MDLDVLATEFPNSTFESTTVRDLCVMLDEELAIGRHYQLCLTGIGRHAVHEYNRMPLTR
jgi:hypothetical protein